jgi:hypothetical protein
MWEKEYRKLMFPIDGSEIDIKRAYKIKYENMPSSLFKYRQINEYSIDNLRNDTVWMTNAQNFNDPYDCALTINENQQLEYIKNRFLELLKPSLKPSQLEYLRKKPYEEIMKFYLLRDLYSINMTETANKFINMTSHDLHTQHNEIRNSLNRQSQRKIYISCFSKIVDSILMWSHYAFNHTGMCIEYNFKQCGPVDLLTRFFHPVNYTNKLFDISDFFFGEKKKTNGYFSILAGITKAMDWSYENEWRLIFPGESSEPFNRKVFKPSTVYLGAKISQEDKEKILSITKRRDIPVLQMYLSSTGFKLFFKPLE